MRCSWRLRARRNHHQQSTELAEPCNPSEILEPSLSPSATATSASTSASTSPPYLLFLFFFPPNYGFAGMQASPSSALQSASVVQLVVIFLSPSGRAGRSGRSPVSSPPRLPPPQPQGAQLSPCLWFRGVPKAEREQVRRRVRNTLLISS